MLFRSLEKTNIHIDNIRLYKAGPTCSMVVAHAQRKLLLNPYPLGDSAENSLTVLIDGIKYSEAFDRFIHAHLEHPWRSKNHSISLGEFISDQNDKIVRSITKQIIKMKLGFLHNKPLIVSINGCTAVGKSTLTKEISSHIQHGVKENFSCTILETDCWITLSRNERLLKELTGFDAEIYDIKSLYDTIKSLSNGQEISGRKYDHYKGFSRRFGTLMPSDILLIDGLMSNYPHLVDLIDLSIWIECSPETHRHLRIERDIRFRGYKPEQAEQNWKIHVRTWPKFEQVYKPEKCITIHTNRSRMFLMDRN